MEVNHKITDAFRDAPPPLVAAQHLLQFALDPSSPRNRAEPMAMSLAAQQAGEGSRLPDGEAAHRTPPASESSRWSWLGCLVHCCGCCCGGEAEDSDAEEGVPLLDAGVHSSAKQKPSQESGTGSPAPLSAAQVFLGSEDCVAAALLQKGPVQVVEVNGIPLCSEATTTTSPTPPFLTSRSLGRPLSPLRLSPSIASVSAAPPAPCFHVLEEATAGRTSFGTAPALQQYLQRFNPVLPVQLQVLPAREPLASATHTGGIALRISGPISYESSSQASLLTVLEDVLLEDCDASLPITEVHLTDLELSPQESIPSQQAFKKDLLLRCLTNSCSLDVLPPMHHTEMEVQANAAARQRQEVLQRVTVFVRNILDSTTELEVLRCRRVGTTPSELEEWSSHLASAATLRGLFFEQCPLTSAHVEALVRGLRRANSSTTGQCFAGLTDLQLSGSLTADCVDKLQRYFEDTFRSAKSLRRLRLPAALLAEARRHPFAIAHPELSIEPQAVVLP